MNGHSISYKVLLDMNKPIYCKPTPKKKEEVLNSTDFFLSLMKYDLKLNMKLDKKWHKNTSNPTYKLETGKLNERKINYKTETRQPENPLFYTHLDNMALNLFDWDLFKT